MIHASTAPISGEVMVRSMMDVVFCQVGLVAILGSLFRIMPCPSIKATRLAASFILLQCRFHSRLWTLKSLYMMTLPSIRVP